MLKLPSSGSSVTLVPACIGIDNMSRWIYHDFLSCIDQADLVPFSALLVSEASNHLRPHMEMLDDKQFPRQTLKSQ